jgi:hypothetical protein
MLSGGGEGSHSSKEPPAELRLERSERTNPLSGVVMAGDLPLDDAWVTAGDERVYTDETGTFVFEDVPLGTVTITRPGYEPDEYEFDGSVTEVTIPMEVRIVRAIHLSSTWTVDDAEFQKYIDLANATTINAFVFDAMGDNDNLLDYRSTVQAVVDHPGMVDDETYDLAERWGQAKEAGLYTILRIMVFVNMQYLKYYPQHALSGSSVIVDPGNRDGWEFPLALAVEACELGFDEINFDYIRYNTGSFLPGTPRDTNARVANITGFLEEAASRLHLRGCAVSADHLGGVVATDGDMGVGQRLEDFAGAVDVVSPMTQPSLWPAGSFGLSEPRWKPKEVLTAILDLAMPRVPEGTVTRPYIQTFYYYPKTDWILQEIQVCEDLGLGWMLWNAYDDPYTSAIGAYPPGTTGEG